MQVLLRVTHTADFDEWCGYVLLGLDKDGIKSLMEERELFQMVHTRDKSLVEMFFWNRLETKFFEDGVIDLDDFLTQAEVTVLESEEILVLPDERETDFDEDVLANADCEQMVFCDRGIHLFAYINDSTGISTPTIEYDTLAKWLTHG